MRAADRSRRPSNRRIRGVICAGVAIGALAGIGPAPTASAAPPILLNGQCGQVLNQARTYVLQNDVGPCNSDGLIIGANSVVLDLNGHTVSGTDVVEDSSGITGGVGEGNGISIVGRRFVTVKNGTVRWFDAGVLLARNAAGTGSTRNLITGLTLRKNVGNQEEGGFPPSGPITEFSEGIALLGAYGNTIEKNLATQNGGAGITINDGSRSNIVRNNEVTESRAHGIRFPTLASANVIHDNYVARNRSNGFNLSFDITDNQIHHNTVEANLRNGINTSIQSDRNQFKNNTVRGNGRIGMNIQSRRNLLAGNIVSGNGTSGSFDGITVTGGSLPPGTPNFGNVLRSNIVQNNTGNGIRITCTRDNSQPGGPCVSANQANRIENNSVSGNGGPNAGTKVFDGGGFLIGFFDLLDGNNHDNPGYPAAAKECDNNVWISNDDFTTHYPHCTAG